MLSSYFLQCAHEVSNEIRANPRVNLEVLIAVKMEKVTKIMLEKVTGRGLKAIDPIKCAIVGLASQSVSKIVAVARANYRAIEVWELHDDATDCPTEVIYDAESEPIPVTRVPSGLLPCYPSFANPMDTEAAFHALGSSVMWGSAIYDPTVVKGNDVYAQPGTVVGPFSYLGYFIHLGQLVDVGAGVVMEGDVVVGEFSKIGAGVVIGKGVRIGARCVIGSHATLKAGVVLPDGAEIDAGLIVSPSI